MCCRREVDLIGEVIGEETHGDLTLAVRVLVDRSSDNAFLKVGSHLGKEVRSDELYFSFETARAESAANRKAVDGVHIKPVEGGKAPEELGCFLEAFVLILVAFDD